MTELDENYEIKKELTHAIIENDEDYKLKKDIAQSIRMVNDHHEKVKQEEEADRSSNSLNLMKRQILKRISEIKKAIYYKKNMVTIYFQESSEGEYLIKTKDGQIIGTLRPDKKLRSRIILDRDNLGNYTSPIFELSKDNGSYFRFDINAKTMKSTSRNNTELSEYLKAAKNDEMLSAAQVLFDKIASKEYSYVDKYILESMEEIIVSGKLESTVKEMIGVYTKLQVLNRQIESKKREIAELHREGRVNENLLLELDVLYKQVCEILLNNGFYRLPEERQKNDVRNH